jgi:hypothetical protein
MFKEKLAVAAIIRTKSKPAGSLRTHPGGGDLGDAQAQRAGRRPAVRRAVQPPADRAPHLIFCADFENGLGRVIPWRAMHAISFNH